MRRQPPGWSERPAPRKLQGTTRRSGRLCRCSRRSPTSYSRHEPLPPARTPAARTPPRTHHPRRRSTGSTRSAAHDLQHAPPALSIFLPPSSLPSFPPFPPPLATVATVVTTPHREFHHWAFHLHPPSASPPSAPPAAPPARPPSCHSPLQNRRRPPHSPSPARSRGHTPAGTPARASPAPRTCSSAARARTRGRCACPRARRPPIAGRPADNYF